MLYHMKPHTARIVTLAQTTFNFAPIQTRTPRDLSPPPHIAPAHLHLRRPPQSVAGQA